MGSGSGSGPGSGVGGGVGGSGTTGGGSPGPGVDGVGAGGWPGREGCGAPGSGRGPFGVADGTAPDASGLGLPPGFFRSESEWGWASPPPCPAPPDPETVSPFGSTAWPFGSEEREGPGLAPSSPTLIQPVDAAIVSAVTAAQRTGTDKWRTGGTSGARGRGGERNEPYGAFLTEHAVRGGVVPCPTPRTPPETRPKRRPPPRTRPTPEPARQLRPQEHRPQPRQQRRHHVGRGEEAPAHLGQAQGLVGERRVRRQRPAQPRRQQGVHRGGDRGPGQDPEQQAARRVGREGAPGEDVRDARPLVRLDRPVRQIAQGCSDRTADHHQQPVHAARPPSRTSRAPRSSSRRVTTAPAHTAASAPRPSPPCTRGPPRAPDAPAGPRHRPRTSRRS